MEHDSQQRDTRLRLAGRIGVVHRVDLNDQVTRKQTNPIPKERCDLATNPASRRAATQLAASVKDGFPPGISQPALRALANAGYTHLDQLSTISEPELGKLHGMGPKAIAILRTALAQNGKSFRTSSES